jgi:hypothetical protein
LPFQTGLKNPFAVLGEDPTFVSSHSLRIVGATALLAAGASEACVHTLLKLGFLHYTFYRSLLFHYTLQ